MRRRRLRRRDLPVDADRDRTIVVALGNDNHWQRACAALGLDHLAEREELSTNAGRRAHRQRGRRRVPGEAGGHAVGACARSCSRTSACRAPRSTTCPRSSSDPQVVARRPSSSTSTRSPGCSAASAPRGVWRPTPRTGRRGCPAPLRGEHGREILAEIGLDDAGDRRAGGRRASYGFRDRDIARRARARHRARPARISSTR